MTVYLDAGTGTNAATITLNTVATSTADGTKSWRVRDLSFVEINFIFQFNKQKQKK